MTGVHHCTQLFPLTWVLMNIFAWPDLVLCLFWVARITGMSRSAWLLKFLLWQGHLMSTYIPLPKARTAQERFPALEGHWRSHDTGKDGQSLYWEPSWIQTQLPQTRWYLSCFCSRFSISVFLLGWIYPWWKILQGWFLVELNEWWFPTCWQLTAKLKNEYFQRWAIGLRSGCVIQLCSLKIVLHLYSSFALQGVLRLVTLVNDVMSMGCSRTVVAFLW
jgi:hypothetical protein